MNTTLLAFFSSSSYSASPQEHPLQAFFFFRAAAEVTGSHVGTGLALSAGVRRASASIMGVDGELRVQSAFFVAVSVFLRLSGTDAPVAILFLRDKEALGACAGFWAVIAPSSGNVARTLKPARVSSDGRV